MILADTAVWSRHFRVGDPELAARLRVGEIAVHPWIVGELALGPGLRLGVIDDLIRLPAVRVVPDAELLDFVLLHRLRGVGWVDAQLVVASLRGGARLWTTDRRLEEIAERFDCAYRPDT